VPGKPLPTSGRRGLKPRPAKKRKPQTEPNTTLLTDQSQPSSDPGEPLTERRKAGLFIALTGIALCLLWLWVKAKASAF
jgi:hypothetical protein